MTRISRRYPWLFLAPWAILGSLAVLAPIAFFLATSNISRDKDNVTRILVEKGAALIRSLEAGARVGMIGMGWGGMQVQRLLVETGKQPDILYLAVTDETGVAVAHSDPGRVGKRHPTGTAMSDPKESEAVKWRQRQTEDGAFVFEVYKRFKPVTGMSGPDHGRRFGMMPGHGFPKDRDERTLKNSPDCDADWCRRFWNPDEGQAGPFLSIFVGLDMGPLELARAKARRRVLGMSAVVLLICFAGMVALFFAQGYKLARRSLAKVRAFSDQVVECLPVGLVASDENGLIAAYNETTEAILGKTGHDALGKAASEVLPRELWQLTDRLEETGDVVEEDLECRTDLNTALPLRVSAAVLRGEKKSFLGYVFIFRDLTEVRRLQQEVERSRRLASLGNLAAGVAHEIRNPLSSIKGFATYFKERFKDHPHDRDTATTMIQEVERLDQVIGQLLEFARPRTLKIRPVRLADVIRHTIKLIEGDARVKGVKVKSEVPADIPDVPMDAGSISQVLLNLYLNAMQAMDDGGTLEVKVARNADMNQTKISVSDTGGGIDPANRERIFDPYFTTKADGTGLGLAIVHNIMEAHTGEVRVESTVGHGTTITLIFPDLEEVQKHG